LLSIYAKDIAAIFYLYVNDITKFVLIQQYVKYIAAIFYTYINDIIKFI